MSMKVLNLKVNREATEVHSMINLLDELRDLLLEAYGTEIVDMLREEIKELRRQIRELEIKAGKAITDCESRIDDPF